MVKFFGCSMLLGIKLSKMGMTCKIWTDNSMLPLLSLLWSVLLYTCPLSVLLKYILSPSTPTFSSVCVCTYMLQDVCACKWRPEVAVKYFHLPPWFSILFFLYRTLTEPGIQLSWITTSRHLPVSMSPVLWWQMHATKPSIFVWVLEDLNSDPHAWLSQPVHGSIHLVVFSLSQGHWLMT